MDKSAFRLEVYAPGSEVDLLGSWPVAAPVYMAVGDVIRTFHIDPNALPTTALRITRVEHTPVLRDGWLTHTLTVFTAVEESAQP